MQKRKLKLFIAVLFLAAGEAGAQSLINLDNKGVIIDGYDPVEYFISGKATEGNEKYQFQYNGSTYYFSSEENKQVFIKNPSKYEVQFGGFCAYAVSQGHVSPIDPDFCIVQKDENGVERLICQHNEKAANLWNANPDGLLVDAYQYWPAVVKNGGRQIKIAGGESFFENVDRNGLAIQGYDAVAYHTKNMAVKGDSKIVEYFHGSKYYFETNENRLLFRENPRKYLPQYGGFCGYAMSIGKVRPVNPEIFQIVYGRLILQHTQEAYELFNEDLIRSVANADKNWPLIEKKHAGRAVKYDKKSE